MRETVRRKLSNQPYREYGVTYTDDSPARAEAVSFFSRSKHALCPANPLPEIIDHLTLDDAQQFLDSHPVQRSWDILTIRESDNVSDIDLAVLHEIPEIKMMKILSNRITDSGIHQLQFLRSVEMLCIYSEGVTDACLPDIEKLASLRALDMQGSSKITRDAFYAMTRKLPAIQDVYPPRARKDGR